MGLWCQIQGETTQSARVAPDELDGAEDVMFLANMLKNPPDNFEINDHVSLVDHVGFFHIRSSSSQVCTTITFLFQQSGQAVEQSSRN